MVKRRLQTAEHRRKFSEAHKGKIFSEEHKRKISESLKGKSKNKGKGHSQSTREKMRLAKLGSKHWNWQGGNPKSSKKQRRQSRIRENGGFHTLGEWENLKAQYNWTCPLCYKLEPEISLTKDHVIPLAKGGSNNIENIQPLCRRCNSIKGTKLIN